MDGIVVTALARSDPRAPLPSLVIVRDDAGKVTAPRDSEGGRLHGYLRAAARLYMSVRDVSQAEYAAVMTRLVKSARTFSTPPLSRNYLRTLKQTFEAMASS